MGGQRLAIFETWIPPKSAYNRSRFEIKEEIVDSILETCCSPAKIVSRLSGSLSQRLIPRKHWSRLALCLPFLLLPLAAQETPAPPPDDVVRHALADQQRVVDLLAKYTYTKRVVSESSNAKGKVTDHQERVFNYAPCEAKTCITLVSVNGASQSPKS